MIENIYKKYTGGTDLSFGTVTSSLQGIKTLNKNLQIMRAANRSNIANAATAHRTQYGFGDEKQLAQLEDILKDRTELKRGNGDCKAQTVAENGRRTVYLNSYKENMTREEKLAMGITLGHESYRDGVVGDAQSQFNETEEAVLGHTALAKRMQGDSMYKDMMTGFINTDINLKNDMTAFDYALATGDWGAFGKYVGDNYDYSADYWLFKLDGSIEDDGNYYFSREIVDEKGDYIPEKIEGSDFTGSKSLALLNAIGIENVQKMLGGTIDSLGQIPDEVIKSVTGLDIDKIPSSEYKSIFENNKEKLITEYLLTKNGANWDSSTSKWSGGNLTIPGLEQNDSLGVYREVDTGKYVFFTAGLDFTREDNAFSVYDDGKGGYKDRKNVAYEDRDNTSATFWMKDVFTGKDIARQTFDNAFTSIDNVNHKNSIVSEYFNMRLIDYDSRKYGVDTVGLFSNAQTAAGNTIDIQGFDGTDFKRFLYHPTDQFGTMEGCFGTMSDFQMGGYSKKENKGTGAYYFQTQLDLYKKLGIYNGYQFNVHLKGRLK
ncbi:hypothetical protein [Treponema sp. Marseille-Q3903]|uniref:hypothetical protein n=1 Tax=Treponema sp. Marseille-Q3903 TaxID=2766703 RepID=UPI0016527E24|nr:hypothetical protein [Treponema sp. Marseille-Q3903]MBC6714034.1 hypothetical protein [Treponema sp. Marseille-Q3903]